MKGPPIPDWYLSQSAYIKIKLIALLEKLLTVIKALSLLCESLIYSFIVFHLLPD